MPSACPRIIDLPVYALTDSSEIQATYRWDASRKEQFPRKRINVNRIRTVVEDTVVRPALTASRSALISAPMLSADPTSCARSTQLGMRFAIAPRAMSGTQWSLHAKSLHCQTAPVTLIARMLLPVDLMSWESLSAWLSVMPSRARPTRFA